jgi:hypothetical protein
LGATVCRARARSRNDSVATRLILVISLANREFVGLVGGGHVEGTTLGIEPVLAEVRGGDRVITSFEAELVAANETISI